MPAISPTQVYDWPSTSGEGSDQYPDENNEVISEVNLAVTTDAVRNESDDNEATTSATSKSRAEPDGDAPSTPLYQQELDAVDFLPNPTPEEKMDILLDLKCAFLSLLAAKVFSLHYVYQRYPDKSFDTMSIRETFHLMVCIPGLLFLLCDPVGTFHTICRSSFRKTTPLFLLGCYLMYLRFFCELPKEEYYLLISPASVAAVNIIHQLLSLTIKLHGIVRHQESFQTVLRFLVGKDNFFWAKLWYGLSVWCMVASIRACVDNFTGAFVLADPCNCNSTTYIWDRDYDDQMLNTFTSMRSVYILAVLLCIVSESFNVSGYLDTENTEYTWQVRADAAYTYIENVLNISKETFQTKYFLFVAIPLFI